MPSCIERAQALFPVAALAEGKYWPPVGRAGAPVAMGYVQSAHVAVDSPVWALVRGKRVAMKVAKTPFVTQRYYRA